MATAPPRPGARHLFIYWRLASTDADVALQTVRVMQHRWCCETPGLHAAVFLREDAPSGQSTVMETYCVAAGQSASGLGRDLQHRIEAAFGPATQAWRQGARHVEVFLACET